MSDTDLTLELCEEIVAEGEGNQHLEFLTCESVCDSIVHEVEKRAASKQVSAYNHKEWLRDTLTDIKEELK